MLQRVKRFAVRLHRDETGPNTVEWILLIIVALLVLVGIYWFVNDIVMPAFKDAAEQVRDQTIDTPGP